MKITCGSGVILGHSVIVVFITFSPVALLSDAAEMPD